MDDMKIPKGIQAAPYSCSGCAWQKGATSMGMPFTYEGGGMPAEASLSIGRDIFLCAQRRHMDWGNLAVVGVVVRLQTTDLAGQRSKAHLPQHPISQFVL